MNIKKIKRAGNFLNFIDDYFYCEDTKKEYMHKANEVQNIKKVINELAVLAGYEENIIK